MRWMRESQESQRGQILPIVAIGISVFLGAAAIAVDVGMLMHQRTRLQATADAAALAAAQDLPTLATVRQTAISYVDLHYPGQTQVVTAPDVEIGNWDAPSQTFTTNGNPINSVRVVANRLASRGNPLPLIFARVFGRFTGDVRTVAVATGTASGPVTRFLIDDEMIDSDVPTIEALANSLGVGSDEIISDNDGDFFIDLPPATVIELPTGQVGDEALFDIASPHFPFTTQSDPSFTDFLNFNEDGSPREFLFPKSLLDPLVGVSDVNNPNLYPSYISPGCQVSPVYKSDISSLNPVSVPALPGGSGRVAVPAVNALGERRGLLAFRIDSIGADPDGPGGSVLPNVWITVCDPTLITIAQVRPAGLAGLAFRLVR